MAHATLKKGIQLGSVFVMFLTLSFFVLSQTRVLAANLSSLNDRLSSAKTSTASNHTIAFRSASGVSSGTIIVNLGNVISSIGSVDFTDVDLSYGGVDQTLAASPGANTWGVSVGSGGVVTFTYPTSCSSPCAAISSGATVTILIGKNATGGDAQMTNSATAGSKYVSIVAGSDVGLFAVSVLSNSSISVSGTASIQSSSSTTPSGTVSVSPSPSSSTSSTSSSSSSTTTTTTTTSPTTTTQSPSPETTPTSTSTSPTTTTKTSPTTTTTTTTSPTTTTQSPSPETTSSSQNTSTQTQTVAPPVTPPSIPQAESITVPPDSGGVSSLTPYVVGVSNAVGGGAQALLQAGSFFSSDGRRVPVKVQVAPMSFLQSLEWTGCSSVLRNLAVLGDTAYNFSAQNSAPLNAGDVAVDARQPVTFTLSYSTTDLESQGIIEDSIRAIAFDPGDCNQKTEFTLNTKDKNVTVIANPKTFFALTGDVRPGFVRTSKLALPTFEIIPVVSDINTQDFNLKDADQNVLATNGDQFVATSNSTIDLCLSSKLFKKPVKRILLSVASSQYQLHYNVARDCFGAKIKIPDQSGAQEVTLKIIYIDDQVQIIKFRTYITSQFQANLLQYALPFLNQIQALNEQVGKTVTQNQPLIQTTAAAAVPVVGVANPSLVTNALNWYYYINHFFSWLLSLLGIRKKRRSWGVVYNAITKNAIDLVIVRLFEKASNRLIETQVTDKSGRFSFLAPPGDYYITATKNPLIFPSHIVKGSIDGDYTHIYRQESFTISTPDQAMTLSIPLDPPAFDHVAVGQNIHLIKWWKTFVGKNPLAPLIVGFLISEILVLYIPNPVNYSLLGFNGFFLVTQIVLGLRSEKSWGLVFDALSLAPVPLAAITLFDAQEGKMLRTRLTDYFGRFSFLTPTGKYLLAVTKEGYQFPTPKEMHVAKYHHLYYGEAFSVKGKKAFIKTNIPVLSHVAEPVAPSSSFVPLHANEESSNLNDGVSQEKTEADRHEPGMTPPPTTLEQGAQSAAVEPIVEHENQDQQPTEPQPQPPTDQGDMTGGAPAGALEKPLDA